MTEKLYKSKVSYYETDCMNIVHHSNYIRYFEDARIQYMHDIGCDVAEMQSKGLYIPNVDAYVFFTGSRMIFDYKIFNNINGELSATGRTTHCFATPELKPISIKHSNPDYYNRLRDNTVSPEDITIRR